MMPSKLDAAAALESMDGISYTPAFDFSALGDLSEQAVETDRQFDLHYGTAQDEYLISCIYVAKMHALTAKAGRYGGTYAHKEIAFEFASWISVEFKLYLVKEFERLKTEEMKQLGWDIKRNLAKINYRIHTDAIKENLIPPKLSARQISLVYANEADVLNMALFGMTAKQWRDAHQDLKGNIRDYANVSQLVCLSNLENLNAVFINEGIPQAERLAKLNTTAISQMKVLTEDHRMLQFDEAKETES